MDDVLLIYFEHIFTFCAVIYSNTNPLQLICEKFSLNTAIITETVIFRVVSRTIYPSPEIFTQVPFVAFVTNSMPDWKADPMLYKNQWVMVSLNTWFCHRDRGLQWEILTKHSPGFIIISFKYIFGHHKFHFRQEQ